MHRQSMISMLISLMGGKAGNEYKAKSGGGIIPACFGDPFFEKKYLPENITFLNISFNPDAGVYDNGMIRILLWKQDFSHLFFTKQNNKCLLCIECQDEADGNWRFEYTWMKLNLPSRHRLYSFLFPELFNNPEMLSGTAFEALFNRIIPEDAKRKKPGKIISKKMKGVWISVKRCTDHVLKNISLITSCKYTYEKPLRPILSAVGKPVFNNKRLFELYDKL